MKTGCGCEYCNDLRHIEPARYIGPGDDMGLKDFLDIAHIHKNFIKIYKDEDGTDCFEIVSRCPVCDYEFTKEDYDSYFL